jgi:hypothetical protein
VPVDTTHPEYSCHCDDWRLMRDVVAGHKAIQKAGEKYLPKLGEQDVKEYEAYKKRAPFFNATNRVVQTMCGMVFRKPPKVDEADAAQEFLEDMTLTGVPFDQLAADILTEQLTTTRCGVLVDFPAVERVEGAPITVAAAQRMGLRAYASLYRAEDIINWRTSQVGGKTVLSLVVLRECKEEPDLADPFKTKARIIYRVLRLVEGRYVQELWEDQASEGKPLNLTMTRSYSPIRNGAALDFIPFEFFGKNGNTPKVDAPILYDLAVVNLAHYRNTADHEHGLHFTGLPTAFIAGGSTEDTYRIGSATAWVFTDPNAKASYLEFKGEGLGQLENAIKSKEGQMAALGARMLAPEKLDAEAAETVAQKRAGETSMLGALANASARGCSKVLSLMSWWEGGPDTITVSLNTDYNPAHLPPQTITALLQAVMAGKISSQSFYDALVTGEVIGDSRTFEEEQALIAEDAASQPVIDDPERNAR